MKTLIIDRKKWRRGHPGSTYLLSPDGMCCLGFDCINEGFSEEAIKGMSVPVELAVKIKGITKEYNGRLKRTKICTLLMETNDRVKCLISEEKREKKTTSLFKKIGREVKFIN